MRKDKKILLSFSNSWVNIVHQHHIEFFFMCTVDVPGAIKKNIVKFILIVFYTVTPDVQKVLVHYTLF